MAISRACSASTELAASPLRTICSWLLDTRRRGLLGIGADPLRNRLCVGDDDDIENPDQFLIGAKDRYIGCARLFSLEVKHAIGDRQTSAISGEPTTAELNGVRKVKVRDLPKRVT